MQNLKNALQAANALNTNANVLNVSSANTSAMFCVLQAKQQHAKNVANFSTAVLTAAQNAQTALACYANSAVYITARKKFIAVKCALNMHNKLMLKHVNITNVTNVSVIYTQNAIILRFKQA